MKSKLHSKQNLIYSTEITIKLHAHKRFDFYFQFFLSIRGVFASFESKQKMQQTEQTNATGKFIRTSNQMNRKGTLH